MSIDKIFEALSSAPRRRILAYLSKTDMTAGEIAERFADMMSQPATSKHLSVLENAGLVASRREGQRVLYALVRDTLMEALSGFAHEFGPAAPARPRKRREAI